MTAPSGHPIAARAASSQDCVKAEVIPWGDGRHDDTAALSAWLKGADAVWATTGKPVGVRISGHSFRLSRAIYVSAGSGRELTDFRFLWPERGERVTGGTIRAGDDPGQPPAMSGVHIEGGDSGEGVPFDLPEPVSAHPSQPASCAVS
ncbi:MAG: hypothetical protein ACM3JG_06250 [Thiohalocapsa sp.]